MILAEIELEEPVGLFMLLTATNLGSYMLLEGHEKFNSFKSMSLGFVLFLRWRIV